MRPILFGWGPFALPSYGLFIGLAIVLSLHLGQRRARSSGLSARTYLDSMFFGVLSGILSSRLLFGIFARGEMSFILSEGRSVLASLLFGTIAVVGFLRWRKERVAPYLDMAFLYIPISQAIGRLGCWCYGCCFGKRCSEQFPLSSSFQKLLGNGGEVVGTPAFQNHLNHGWIGLPSGRSLPVHPVQLYEAVICVFIFLLLSKLAVRRLYDGHIFHSYLIFYGTARFGLEFLRGDNSPVFLFLTPAQIICIVSVCIGIFLRLRRQYGHPSIKG